MNFANENTTLVGRDYVPPTGMAPLGNETQIGWFPSVSHHPQWPRKFGVAWLHHNITDIFATELCQCKYHISWSRLWPTKLYWLPWVMRHKQADFHHLRWPRKVGLAWSHCNTTDIFANELCQCKYHISCLRLCPTYLCRPLWVMMHK